MFETRLWASPSKNGWWGCMCSYNPAKTVIYLSYVLGIWDLKAGLVPRTKDGQHHFSMLFSHKGLTLFVTETWKTFLHSATSNATQLCWSVETPRWRKTKWRESMQLENDKFCDNYPSRRSLKSSWFLCGILNKNLDMRGVEGNTFFWAEHWIEGN